MAHRQDWIDQIIDTKKAVRELLAKTPIKGHDFGHAFLWGTIELKLKNGKSRYTRECLGGSVCAEDLYAVCRLVETIPGITNVTYNLD